MAERTCAESSPLEGFKESDWEAVCKTPVISDLVPWVSQQLVGQDIEKICSCLSINREDLPQSGDKRVYHKAIYAWLDNHPNKTGYFSELLSSLSVLKIPGFVAHKITEIMSEIGYQDENTFRNDSPDSISRSNSESSSCSLRIFSEAYRKVPADFTENEDMSTPILELRTYTEPVSSIPCSSSGSGKINEGILKRVKSNMNLLQKKFTRLLRYVNKMYRESSLPLSELRVFLSQRCADEQENIPLFSTLTIDLMGQATADELFMLMSRVGAWNFLNYYLLEELVEEFGFKNTSEFSCYKEELEIFKNETLLIDFLSVWSGRCDKDHSFACLRSVIVKSIADPASFTIADAYRMSGFLADQFDLKQLAFRLESANTGSVYIKWLVSVGTSKYILKAMCKEDRPDLLEFGILGLWVEQKNFKSTFQFENVHRLSVADPRLFWGGVGAKELVWRKKSKEVYSHNKETGEFHWFRGAELNVSENCLDCHVKRNPDKRALIWERDDEKAQSVTYRELLEQTCRVANVLKKRGIKKGDVVVICMPTMPLAVASMLACARIGAIHCVLFSDINDEVLYQRIKELEAKTIITSDIRVIEGVTIGLQEKIVRALSKRDTSVETVLVARRSDTPPLEVAAKENSPTCHIIENVCYYSLEKEMQQVSSECDPVPIDGEDILFIAYTSGTQSGTSKAVFHTQAGYLLYAKVTYKFIFNLAPDDIMGCVSDLGWIAAHSCVVYGPLSNGNTTLLFESTATYPDNARYWRMVDKLKLTHIYTTPSVLKELRIGKNQGAGLAEHNLSSLKVIVSGGNPIPSDIEQWYFEEVGEGKCLFLDNWGQTELGGAGIIRWKAPEGKAREDFSSSQSFALFGVDLSRNEDGTFSLKQPLPGMGKFVLAGGKGGLKKPYEQDYYRQEKGGYSMGDVLESTQNQFRVMGRKDRTLRVKGVWLSLANIEDQLRIRLTEDIYDAIILVDFDQELGNLPGSLYVVLQTHSAVDYEHRELASYHQLVVSNMEDIFAENILNQLQGIYLLPSCLKKYLPQTMTKKTSHLILKNFLIDHNRRSPSPSASEERRCEVIKERELRQFVQEVNPASAIAAH